MKKTAPLLFVFGLIALSSCKKQEASGRLTINADALKGQSLQVLSAFGVESETFTPPTRTYGSTTLNVQDFGATGGNTTDDTQAIQAAIDALPADGGTVWIPAGTYYINADFKTVDSVLIGTNAEPTNCLKLRSNMRLLLSPYAHLKEIATDAYAAMIIYVHDKHDVQIEGQISGSDTSELVGERYNHLTSVGEGGHGIQLRGAANVTIKNLRLRDFWGDGITISSTFANNDVTPQVMSSDVVIDNVRSTNNRRQGLSIGPSHNVQVWDSEFSNINGTSPQCGIDIEPEAGLYADTVLIQNNIFSDNVNNGINLHSTRAQNVDIKHNNIVNNGAAGLISNGTNAYIAFNSIHNNGAGGNGRGVALLVSSIDNTIVQNVFYQNNGEPARDSTLSIYGTSTETEKDIFINASATNPVVYTNTYK